jgi:hypothetical protein
MKDLQPNILDDYERQINMAIERHHDEAGFPQMDSYHVDRTSLDDYLFDYQAVLDSEGSQRSQLTKYGIIALLPVVILSAFPESQLPWRGYSLLVGVAMGVVIALGVKGIRLLVRQSRLRSVRAARQDVAAYCDAVSQFVNSK